MLRLSNELLKNCQEIKNAGIEFAIIPGVRLARGFADLGFEEFILMEGNKLISLYRGTQSELLEEEQKHFFRIPNLYEIQKKLYELKYDIQGIEFQEQRTWQLKLEYEETKAICGISATDLETLFLRALHVISTTR